MTPEPKNYGEPWAHILAGSCKEKQSVWCSRISTSRNDNFELDGLFDDYDALLHRIVACVNACAGIPTEELENNKVEIKRTKIFQDFSLAVNAAAARVFLKEGTKEDHELLERNGVVIGTAPGTIGGGK